jgi:O-antigen biosynthesis protein
VNLSLLSHLGMIDERTVGGFALDQTQPDRKLVVEILIDDAPAAALIADAFSPALALQGRLDAFHGFIHPLIPSLARTSQIITARLANAGTPIGAPINLAQASRSNVTLSACGAVERVDGQVVRGWVLPNGQGQTLVRALSVGEEIAATEPSVWTTTLFGAERRPVLAFELALPAAIADSEVHSISIVSHAGTEFMGSPFSLKVAKPKRTGPAVIFPAQ